MFRTAATIGVVALVGLVAFRIAFGMVGGVISLLLGFAWLALKLLLVFGLVYLALTVVWPDAARRIREAIEIHVEGLRADGLPVPKPSSRVDYVEIPA